MIGQRAELAPRLRRAPAGWMDLEEEATLLCALHVCTYGRSHLSIFLTFMPCRGIRIGALFGCTGLSRLCLGNRLPSGEFFGPRVMFRGERVKYHRRQTFASCRTVLFGVRCGRQDNIRPSAVYFPLVGKLQSSKKELVLSFFETTGNG
ncbi:unnamed protein product [Ectocarpus sp. 12 AP-2014]